MTIATVACRAQLGLYAPLVQVEISLDVGLPVFSMVGLPATVVKESKERVRAALLNSGFEFPAGRITVNLSPADLPKRGGRFDLPIALGILLASRQLRGDPGTTEFYGELGLSGELKSVSGLLLAAAHAARDGHEVVIPKGNAEEVSVLPGGHATPMVRVADHLRAVCDQLLDKRRLPPLTSMPMCSASVAAGAMPDLGDVRGQLQAKRALTVAAAGAHSLLMIGPPGSGKSMLARRLPALLPPMTEAESLEVAAIASISDAGFSRNRFGRRPVRTPHHTASAVALVGGGSRARPGEISLAHHGVLFLDELLEYDRHALEALREPLESGVVSVSRAAVQAQYPAEFQLVAAMNPCPCGRLGDPCGSCICTPAEVARYRARISAPLLDRLDIHIEVPRVDLNAFEGEVQSDDTAVVRARVARARGIQLMRQGVCNARLSDAQMDRVCAVDESARLILRRAMEQFGLSARARQRILKLARTIADLSEDAVISSVHVGEAVMYRALDRRALEVVRR
ncbi:MAG TPA: YifB family Mg chelatase-like AAA ATPase [Steroidobacteraceae bacterium]|jgi:magnesium chelatase family protein